MADFLVSLWESIFTPGPTPTLLVATNATFACLQVLLLTLLVFTKSIHFIVLSFLCGGLWYAINWFAREIQAVQKQEAADGSKKDKLTDSRRSTVLSDLATRRSPEPGSDTETETQKQPVTTPLSRVPPSTRKATPSTREGTSSAQSPSSTSSLLKPEATSSEADLLRRRRSLGESSGYISTDSEWEKVSEGEGKSR